MRSPLRLVALLMAASTLVAPASAGAASPRSRSVSDRRGDEHHGPGWHSHPAARSEADLRRTTVAVRGRYVVFTFGLGRLRRNPRNTLEVAMDVGLVQRRSTDELDLSVGVAPGRRSGSVLFIDRTVTCGHSVTTSVHPRRRDVVTVVPRRCLGPSARALTDPRIDSTLTAPDFTPIATDISFGTWRLPLS